MRMKYSSKKYVSIPIIAAVGANLSFLSSGQYAAFLILSCVSFVLIYLIFKSLAFPYTHLWEEYTLENQTLTRYGAFKKKKGIYSLTDQTRYYTVKRALALQCLVASNEEITDRTQIKRSVKKGDAFVLPVDDSNRKTLSIYLTNAQKLK